LLFCLCFFCILCINKRKQKNAEKNKEQMKISSDQSPTNGQTKDGNIETTNGAKVAYSKVSVETSVGDMQEKDPYTTVEMGGMEISKAGQPQPFQKVISDSAAQPMMSDQVTKDVSAEEEEEIDVELVGDDLYFVTFTQKPFGISFGKNDEDKRNLYVTNNDANAVGYQESVIVNSYIAKLDKEVVEGLGAKKIFKIFKNQYADKCPLKITFRKPNEIENKEADEDTPEPPENPTLQAEQEAAEALAAGGGDEDAEYEYEDENANANDEEYEYYDEEEEDIMNQVGGDDADGYEE